MQSLGGLHPFLQRVIYGNGLMNRAEEHPFRAIVHRHWFYVGRALVLPHAYLYMYISSTPSASSSRIEAPLFAIVRSLNV